MLLFLVNVATCIKLLCVPAYISTDFEVHRNWLAITHSLPISQWYTDTTSPWTLDYPPLFAMFEYLLSQIAYFFDPKMLDVNNLDYKSDATVMFQRLSVIVTDFVLAYGVKECSRFINKNMKSVHSSIWLSTSTVFQILVLFSAGLFYVDHIHFQYNGFLFGILLLSIARILEGRNYEGAFWFAVLLNLKHIFLYIAPAYFVYLLRNQCFPSSQTPSILNFSLINFVKLGVTVLSVFFVSFAPFITQIPQIMSRLFPFDNRGLCHAYWAPNIWALYNTFDKVGTVVGKQLNMISPNVTNTMSRGLVQNAQHVILPSISPMTCLILTLLGNIPCCILLWRSPRNPLHFVRCMVLCAATSFMFGWHVHEKAILMVIIPFTLLAVASKKEAKIFVLLSTSGYFSLFPLLFEPFEIPTKTFIYLTQCVYSFGNIAMLDNEVNHHNYRFPLLNILESLYLITFCFVDFFDTFIINYYFVSVKEKFPFLNLMLMSVYCAIGIVYCYFKYYYYYFIGTKYVRRFKSKRK